MSDVDHLERSYRRWLRCYPVSWRRHHGGEMLSILLQQAQHDHRRRPDLASIIDMTGHGVGERIESLSRWIPFRRQLATMASVLGGVLAITFLVVIEIGGALHREVNDVEAGYFVAGPFLSIGVVVYLSWILSFACIILRRSGLGRLMITTSVAMSILMIAVPLSLPRPRLLILILLISIGVLAVVDEARPPASVRNALAVLGVVVVAMQAVAVVVLAGGDQLLNGYSNVALRRIGSWLVAVEALGVIAAAAVARRRPGWFTATMVCSQFPCSMS